jgi:predicted class III extradiol MEMO1 family dioxygenase
MTQQSIVNAVGAVTVALPLLLSVQMVKHCPQQFSIEFKCYDQSSKVVSSSDSSVSYATAVMTAMEGDS